MGEKDHARDFGLSMASGQAHQALQTLAEKTTGGTSSGVLQMGETVARCEGRSASVKDLLAEKHPPPQQAPKKILLEDVPTQVSPIRFEAISLKLIERVALQYKGSAGPFRLDADAWRHVRC